MKANRMSVFGLIAVTLVANALGAATWDASFHAGSWTNAENWTDGVMPSATTSATLTAAAGDYDIAVESDTTLYATNTTIGNTGGVTRFNVNSPITFFPGMASANSSSTEFKFVQSAGTVTTVGPNGMFVFDGPLGYGSSSGFQVGNSDFIVDGGQVDLHTTRSFHLTGTARLIVTNGGSFAWHGAGDAYGTFKMDPSASIHVHDGTFGINETRNFYWGPVFEDVRGDILVSGTGTFKAGWKNAAESSSGQAQPFFMRGGKMHVTDQAAFSTTSGSFELAPSSSGKTVEVTFDGQSTFSGSLYAFYVGDSLAADEASVYDAARSVFNWRSSKRVTMGNATVVGHRAGTGVLNIENGYVSQTYFGLYVGALGTMGTRNDYKDGWKRPTDYSKHSPTGIVTISGGALVVNTEAEAAGYNSANYCGLLVGDGSSLKDASLRPAYGQLELSGSGVVSNASGRIIVGYGRATGRFVQTGGRVWKGYISTQYGPEWGGNATCAVGLAGGDGEWRISGGATELYASLFVGGATKADLVFDVQSAYDSFGLYDDTKGVLSVSGTGTFKQYNHETAKPEIIGVWLGRDGDGTLEVSGSKATVQMRNLVMTNGYANAEGEVQTPGRATVRFVADANGVSTAKIAQKLYVAPNAKLEVDVEAYRHEGRPKKLKLVDCASRVGSFAPENIVVKGPAVVLQNEKTAAGADDPDIYVKIRPGMVLILR